MLYSLAMDIICSTWFVCVCVWWWWCLNYQSYFIIFNYTFINSCDEIRIHNPIQFHYSIRGPSLNITSCISWCKLHQFIAPHVDGPHALLFPLFLCIQSAIVCIIGFVVHHKGIINEIKWIRSRFKWICYHLAHWNYIMTIKRRNKWMAKCACLSLVYDKTAWLCELVQCAIYIFNAFAIRTHLIHPVAVEIRTRARMCSLNVEYSIQIENRMFLVDAHGKNDVQSYESFSPALLQL